MSRAPGRGLCWLLPLLVAVPLILLSLAVGARSAQAATPSATAARPVAAANPSRPGVAPTCPPVLLHCPTPRPTPTAQAPTGVPAPVTVAVPAPVVPAASALPTAAASDDPNAVVPGTGLIGSIIGNTPNEVPVDHYDIGYSTSGFGGSENPGKIIPGFTTDFLFGIIRWLVAGMLWLLQWSLQFQFAQMLAAPAAAIASTFQHQLLDRLGLPATLLTLAACLAGWHVLRGRTSRGAADFATSIVISVLAVGVLAAPATLLLGSNGQGGLLGHTRQLAVEIGQLVESSDPSGVPAPATGQDASTVLKPMTDSLRHAFLVEPHQLVDFGTVFDDNDPSTAKCLGAYQQIVASGPYGTSNTPRDMMRAVGCSQEADFNSKPSVDRVLAAALVLLATVVMFVLVLVITGGLIAAQIALVGVIIGAPFALTAGVLPGVGRDMLIKSVTTVLTVLAVVVMTVVFLTLLTVMVGALLSASAGKPYLVRIIMLDGLTICSFVFRRRLVGAGRRGAEHLGQRLRTATPSAGSPASRSLLGGAGLASAGFLAGAWEENRREIGAVTRHLSNRRLARAVAGDRGAGRAASAAVMRNAAGPASTATRAAAGAATGTAAAAAAAHVGEHAAAAGAAAKAPGAATRLHARLVRTRSGRVASRGTKLGVTALKLTAMSTVGAPVYLPRAGKAAAIATRARSAATKTALRRGTTTAKDFAHTYVRNVTAPVRVAAPPAAVAAKATVRAAGTAGKSSGRAAAAAGRTAVRGTAAAATAAALSTPAAAPRPVRSTPATTAPADPGRTPTERVPGPQRPNPAAASLRDRLARRPVLVARGSTPSVPAVTARSSTPPPVRTRTPGVRRRRASRPAGS